MIKKTKDDTVSEEYEDSKTGSQTGFDDTQYQDDGDTYQDSTVQEEEETPKAKNVKTKNMILFAVFGLACAGILYKVVPLYLGGSSEQTPPAALAPVAQAPQPAETPVPEQQAPVQAPVAPVAQEPAATLPVQQENTVPNLGATPAPQVPVNTAPQVPVNTAEQPPALGGQTNEVPKPSLGNESLPVLANTDAPKATAVVDNETKESIDRLIDRVGAMDDTVQNVNDTMNSVKDMVKTHTDEISSLDVRVTKLEDAMKAQQEKMAALEEAKKEAAKPAVKPVVKKKATVKKSTRSASKNSVHIVSSDAPRKAVRSSSSSSSHKSVSSNGSHGYTIQAVLPGRAWVKNPNGTTSTYSIGDTLPTGNKVGKIDPDGGVFDSTGKRWPN